MWDGPMFQEEAATLLTSKVVICSGCEISHFQLHFLGHELRGLASCLSAQQQGPLANEQSQRC